MQQFCEKYKISEEDYKDLRDKILNFNSPQAVKKFRDLAFVSFSQASEILFKEFCIEKKIASQIFIYKVIQNVENYIEKNDVAISSDIYLLIDYAREQLSK